jgi:hypothetical protein
VDGLDIAPGSYADALAEIACAQARQTDAGSSHASVSLRMTLQSLDDALGLVPPSNDLEWFTLFDIRFGIAKEGIRPDRPIGQALIKAGYRDLISHRPPPDFPPGWRGTSVSGTVEEYAKTCSEDYRTYYEQWKPKEPFGFWRGDVWRYVGPTSESATSYADVEGEEDDSGDE